MATYYWIVHTGAFGDVDKSVTLKGTKAQAGAYIRENLGKFMFCFGKLGVCGREMGQVGDVLRELPNYDDIDFYDNAQKKDNIVLVRNALKKFSDTKLIDQLWGSSDDTEKDYIKIIKIKADDVVDLEGVAEAEEDFELEEAPKVTKTAKTAPKTAPKTALKTATPKTTTPKTTTPKVATKAVPKTAPKAAPKTKAVTKAVPKVVKAKVVTK